MIVFDKMTGFAIPWALFTRDFERYAVTSFQDLQFYCGPINPKTHPGSNFVVYFALKSPKTASWSGSHGVTPSVEVVHIEALEDLRNPHWQAVKNYFFKDKVYTAHARPFRWHQQVARVNVYDIDACCNCMCPCVGVYHTGYH